MKRFLLIIICSISIVSLHAKENLIFEKYLSAKEFHNGHTVVVSLKDTIKSNPNLPDQVPTLNIEEVDQVPLFKGCKNKGTQEEQKKCTSFKVQEFVLKNFNMKIPTKLKLKGEHDILIKFKVNTLGEIIDVEAKGSHPLVEKEAIRTVRLFPNMTSGQKNGKPVNVSYSFPIIFWIAG